jgi:MYXO-CTERM domain-containing protein
MVTPGTECRAANGVCDVAETCNGSVNCPADGVASSSHMCRASVGECDVEEDCDGSTKACPADALATAGSPCGNSAISTCDNADTCDNAGNCNSNYAPAGTGCGSALTSECNSADSCNGSGICLTNYSPDGTNCSMGECHSGFCSLPLTDAGADSGTDAGHSHHDAGQQQDAQISDGSLDGQAPSNGGAGGTGGAGFGLGGRGGTTSEGGLGGATLDGVNGGSPDASVTTSTDAGTSSSEIPANCKCSLPGQEQHSPLGMWAALGLLGIVVLRRRRCASTRFARSA